MLEVRALSAAVVVLGLLVAAVLAIDLGVTAVAEDRVAERVREEFGTSAEVTITGWPVAVRTLATGQVPHVEVRASDVAVRGGRIDRLLITLSGVEFDLADVQGRPTGLPAAEEARFEATIGQEALRGLLQLPAVMDLSMTDGAVVLTLPGVAVIEAAVIAMDGIVVVQPDSPHAALLGLDRIPVDLSDQTGRPHVEDVEISGGTLVLRGRLEGLSRDPG